VLTNRGCAPHQRSDAAVCTVHMATQARPVVSQKCQKPGDYDTWSPPLPQQCLLGRNITMQRRKPDAMCFNGYDFTADDTISPCNCTEADIECEFGFEWSGHDCMPVPHVEASQCPVRAAQGHAACCHHILHVLRRPTCVLLVADRIVTLCSSAGGV